MNGVDEERELRARLESAYVPPTRLEVGALLLDGRRRQKRRRAVLGAAVAMALLVTVPSILLREARESAPVVGVVVKPSPSAPASAAPPAACPVRTLPVPAGMKNVTPTGIDPTGRFIVGNGTVGQNFHPVLWTDGKPQALPMVGQSVELDAVNSSGVVAGLVANGTSEYAFRWQNGKYTRLRTPPGSWHVYPWPRINTAGDVVMMAEPSANIEGKGAIAVLWKAGSTKATKLPLPKNAGISDIDDAGRIVGDVDSDNDGSADLAYVWDQQGHGTKLKQAAGQQSAARAIRGDWVTGGFWPRQAAVRWNLRTGEMKEFATPENADLPPALDGVGPGEMVNAKGWVVASGYVLRDDGPAVLTVPKGLTAKAAAVSDDGVVVGIAQNDAHDATANQGPRLWQC
ncbi:hypothetical protein ACQP2F_06475 [Actinoplanes sp. CA-030573]|uniref:hypothetical protein n=1 Tax=Actinoplanes sp. CA-030573 TaxID=3239898 RepID=UPI003D90DF1D